MEDDIGGGARLLSRAQGQASAEASDQNREQCVYEAVTEGRDFDPKRQGWTARLDAAVDEQADSGLVAATIYASGAKRSRDPALGGMAEEDGLAELEEGRRTLSKPALSTTRLPGTQKRDPRDICLIPEARGS